MQRGQVSRARQELVGAKLAPKDQTTLNELRGRRPQEQLREIPADVMSFEPETAVQLDRKIFATCLRGSPSGSSPGPGGCTNEMLRVVLDDPEALFLLTAAAEDFARADVPQCIFGAFMLATMTALRKRDGGVRGIATGSSFRRLVAKTLARQFMEQVEESCAPFQFALSTRAGTDCVEHAIRVVTERQPDLTVLSIDGIGAYDHVYRSSIMAKLHEVPGLRKLLPFVRRAYSRPSRYSWVDSQGERHWIQQHEGGEQGDPLMPLLFSLAIHDALREVSLQLQEEELLFAYLDDVYVVSKPDRTRFLYDLLADRLYTLARIELHEGKTRVWNRAGECPPGMVVFGDDVWSFVA